MADRVAVFNAGRIAQVGTPQEIYERPRTRFVADFVGSSNVLPPALAARFGARRAGRASARRRCGSPAPRRPSRAPSPPPATSAPARASAVDIGGVEIALVAPAGRAVPEPGARVGLAWAPGGAAPRWLMDAP